MEGHATMSHTKNGTQTHVRIVLDLTITGSADQNEDEVRAQFMQKFAPDCLATLDDGVLGDYALNADGVRAWEEHLTHGGGDAEGCEHMDCTMRDHLPLGGYPGPFITAAEVTNQ